MGRRISVSSPNQSVSGGLLPHPRTSLTVMPVTPSSFSAVLTASSVCGRMMQSTFFIGA